MNFSSQNAGLGDLEDSLESNPFADSPPSRHTEENNNTLAIGQDLPTQEPDQPYTAEEPESTAVAAAATAQSSDDVDVAQNLENLHIYTEQSAEQQQQQQQETYHQQEQEQQQSGEQQDSQSESFEIPKSGSRPYFEVSVQDPQKVGDTINAHIVYKVRTKTNSPAFRAPEVVVARRYRDFLWLYNQLTLGNPGVIVPPVPEKHALGRFQDEFVESRRIALERCLQKIVSHPMLYGDPDLKVFLESESFNVEKRQKRAEPEQPKIGLMRSFGETISNAASNPFSKFVEVDEWFASKKNQLDALEAQLKALLKSVESVVKQRKSMIPLASAELDHNLSSHLKALADIHKQMKELHEQQAHHDVLTLEHTIDEYIRIIGSIRALELAFNTRIKAYQTFQQAESEWQKKLALQEKLRAQSKTDRANAAQQEINEAKQRMDECNQEYQEISKLIKSELDRFDKDKVDDFRQSVEQFLASMIEHQKQAALWESFFQQTEAFVESTADNDAMVPPVTTSTTTTQQQPQQQQH
ncbi:hypothetical protein VTP01DRAFT_9330 [Rhizomucor pusillus]|uniref:uncharacterized protein n=1 Tax=Rhizomucor pusillus TaxID=4840 RepID=UPI003742A174